MARSSRDLRPQLAVSILFLLMLQVLAATGSITADQSAREILLDSDRAAAAGRAPVNTICSDIPQPNGVDAGATGQCDDWDSSHDESPNSQEWVEATYTFTMVNTTVIEMEMTWVIYEFNRSQISLDINLGNNSLPERDGIPADYIRNYFNAPVGPGGQTVKNLLEQETRNSLTRLIDDGFGQSSDVQVAITGGDNPYADSQDEPTTTGTVIPGILANAFQPPVVMSASADIILDTSTFSLDNNTSGLDLERTLQALLTMGANVTTDFSVFARTGHIATFELRPPDYATMVGVDNTGRLEVRNDGNFQYRIAAWDIDNRGAFQSSAEAERDVNVTLSRRDSATRVVQIDTTTQKGVDVGITLDMRDTMATLDVVIEMFYVDANTLDAWGISLTDDNGQVEMPWVTSDGIRMAHDNGLIDLDELSDAMPMDAIADGLSGFAQENVTMNPVIWSPPDNRGGLNFSHRTGVTCSEAGAPKYCISGSNAMNATYPVYLSTESQPFRMSLIDLAAEQAPGGNDSDFDFNFSVLGEDDLESLLNAGLEIEVDLGSEFVSNLIPAELPPSEVTITVLLPDWARSQDGRDFIQIKRYTNGSADAAIALEGTRPYDWQSLIRNDDSQTVCPATKKTCMAIYVELDFIDLVVKEWQQQIDLTLQGSIHLELYRIGLPEDAFGEGEDAPPVSIDVIPADLIRLFIDIGERQEGGLYSTEIDMFDENVTLEISNTGLDTFLGDISRLMTDEVRGAGDDMEEEAISLDLSGITITADKENILAPDSRSISDSDPIDLTLALQQTTVSAKYADRGLAITTSWFDASMNALLGALTNSFFGALPMAEDGEVGAGLTVPPGGEQVPIDIPAVSFDAAGQTANPLLVVSIAFPEGIGFGEVSSKNGNVEKVNKGGRQQLIYTAPLGADDELEFDLVVAWGFFAGELAGYALGAGGIVALLVFRRIRKRAAKERILEEEFERASRMRTSAMDFDDGGAGMDAGGGGGGGFDDFGGGGGGGFGGGGDDWGDDQW